MRSGGKTVAFTGYRPQKMPFTEHDSLYQAFRDTEKKVITWLAKQGYTYFISGGADGFDLWVAEDVLALRQKFS